MVGEPSAGATSSWSAAASGRADRTWSSLDIEMPGLDGLAAAADARTGRSHQGAGVADRHDVRAPGLPAARHGGRVRSGFVVKDAPA